MIENLVIQFVKRLFQNNLNTICMSVLMCILPHKLGVKLGLGV